MKKTTLPIILALLLLAPFGAKAQTGVENYVSASGFMIYHAPSYYAGTDGYVFDFEPDYGEGRLLDWTTIDADGDGHHWRLPTIGGGYGHNGSDGVLFSYSYDNYSGVLNPDNYLVSPRVSITANNHVVKFFACALDESYPAEHFGFAVSTTTNQNASAFTLLQEWTMTAKQGGWHEYSVDLESYVGQEVYVAIRHFNCSDNFCLCVDDIVLGNGTLDPLVGCDLMNDGALVAHYEMGINYLLDTDGYANNSTHQATVRAVYQSGTVVEETSSWTYRDDAGFAGSPSGLHADSDGSTVTLSWDLPMNSVPFTVEELYYDFADSTLSDLTLIDANHDGQNFRVYPYGGYGGSIGLRSFSWMNGPGALNPDNFIVTPRLTPTENAMITFMACDADMPGLAPDPEHFGVAVSTSGNTNAADFVMVQEWNSTGVYTEYSVDLSAYAGQQIYVAIRHFNTTGETYFLCVDNIRLTGVEAEVTRPAKGALVYANGALVASLTHGETSYVHNVNRYQAEYCIRVIQDGRRENGDYFALAAPQCASADLECLAPKNLAASWDGQKVTLTWERELYTGFEEDPEGWTFLDVDGDGFVFGIYAAGGMDPSGTPNTTGSNPSLTSFSYNNDHGSLTPDNYAFMPLVKVLPNASMTFWASGFDPSYPNEHFGVAVASADGMTINTIAEWTTSYPYTKYSVDLSAYAGQEIYLGFRHFTTVANYALCIDDITVTNVVWSGTASVTSQYHVYRSFNGSDYHMIGAADADAVSYEDYDIQAVDCYYRVTAINTMPGNRYCESAPAMAYDGIHDFVHVTTDAVSEMGQAMNVYPNPTHGLVTIEAEGMTRVAVVNALGQMMEEVAVEGDQVTLDLSAHESGLFIVRIQTANGVVVRPVMLVR